MLVEDEFLISEWVAESLSEQGFAVHTVTNAGEALRYLATEPVDVLFTDINLPGGMDGAALARRARELLPDLPLSMPPRGTMLDPTRACPARFSCRSPMCRPWSGGSWPPP